MMVLAQGFLYHSDSYADDLPYWEDINGKPQLVVPYTFDANAEDPDPHFGKAEELYARSGAFSLKHTSFHINRTIPSRSPPWSARSPTCALQNLRRSSKRECSCFEASTEHPACWVGHLIPRPPGRFTNTSDQLVL